MKTKFNEFLNENDSMSGRDFLLSQSFIIEDQKTKELKVVAVGYRNFPESIINKFKRTYVPLTYESLVRFFLFVWLFKYKGDNEILNNIKLEMSKTTKSDFFRPFSQIPTNFTVMRNNFNSIIGSAAIKSTDVNILSKLIQNKDILFTEENIIKWYNTINGLTNRANKGEERTIKFIIDNKLFTSARPAQPWEDKQGIDIVANKGADEITIQVKEPAQNTDIKMYRSKRENNDKFPYIILIKNTNLEIHKYFKGTDGALPWKFLFLWDHKKGKLYSINSHSITSINKAENNNLFISMDLTDEWLPKMIKTYNIPKK